SRTGGRGAGRDAAVGNGRDDHGGRDARDGLRPGCRGSPDLHGWRRHRGTRASGRRARAAATRTDARVPCASLGEWKMALDTRNIGVMNFHYVRHTLDRFLADACDTGVSRIELWGAAPHFYIGDETLA